jgi:hypothetical protein
MAKMPVKFLAPIKCFVKESKTNFLVTDGLFFLTAYFTKQALDQFKKAKPGFSVENLRGFLVNLQKWHCELALVDSTQKFTSYANLELRLVIDEFSLASDTQQELENKHPTNLFRDDDCRAFIQAYLYH